MSVHGHARRSPGTMWRRVEDLRKGDRIELGFEVCDVVAVSRDGVVLTVEGRHGVRDEVFANGVQVRYCPNAIRQGETW